MPNHFVTPPMGASIFGLPPNYGSAPIPQVAPIVSTQVAPMSLPQTSSSTSDPVLAKLREDLHKMFLETFGNESKVKSHVYQKPYPEHFDAISYLKVLRFLILLNLVLRVRKQLGSM